MYDELLKKMREDFKGKQFSAHKYMNCLLSELEKSDETPELLLHSCCAPCSSSVLERLTDRFSIVLFFFNPNMDSLYEYEKRLEELHSFTERFPHKNSISIVAPPFDSALFYEAVKGYESAPERGERCRRCIELRLRQTALFMKEYNKHSDNPFAAFATTLTLSPLKNAAMINSAGMKISEEEDTAYLPSDFKKNDGYKRSIELSAEYGLYRQNYCGCIFSRKRLTVS